MYTISKDFSFAAAHAIRGHTGGCENLHGHNYRVRVHLRARHLDGLGMVLDFARLKAIMQEVLGPFDHRVLNEVPPFDDLNTTAELLARHVFTEVSHRLAGAPGAAGREPETGAVVGGGEAASPATPETSADAAPRGLSVARVEVWENDTSCAVFEP